MEMKIKLTKPLSGIYTTLLFGLGTIIRSVELALPNHSRSSSIIYCKSDTFMTHGKPILSLFNVRWYFIIYVMTDDR